MSAGDNDRAWKSVPSADTSAPVYDVFLSYANADAVKYRDLIESIKEEIQNEIQDYSCRRLVFLDTDALNRGDEWEAIIKEKLQECRVFICLLSENYFASNYCTRERLWWGKREIQRGRLRQDTMPVYFISLNGGDPFSDTRRQVCDLFGLQMERVEGKLIPWFEGGMDAVKNLFLQERIDSLKNAVKKKLSSAKKAATSFNNVFPPPSVNFVGRLLELGKLRAMCVNSYPVIEGPAGVGKSELATVYAYGYADAYPQGRFLVHMEGIRSWEDAVLSMVNDPDSGPDVQFELGITEEDMTKDKKILHRMIIRKLFARAEKGRLLLILDNVDDASLFEENSLLDFSLNRSIPDAPDGGPGIHMIATTRNNLTYSKNNYAVAFPLDNLDEDASFELFCEIGHNVFPFCRRPILDKKNDPDRMEYDAAMEIIRLLEGHVWSMEIVAKQMEVGYDNGITFQKKLALLKKSFSISSDGEKRRMQARSKSKNAESLLRPTLDILRNNGGEGGDAIVRLAFFAAMLSPDGEKKEILHACWDMHYGDVKFEEDSDAFLYAYNQLWRYCLIHGKDDDKMHRLTQDGLKQIMKDDGVFNDCLEKLADVIARTLSVPKRIWIEAISNTPELMECLDRKHPAFFSLLVSPADWVELLAANPSNPIFVRLCPWDALSGWEWSELLGKQPDPSLVERCPWVDISWVDLLPVQPQFADRCPWEELDLYDIAEIVRDQPQFADKCPWDKLNIGDKGMILAAHPELAEQYGCSLNDLSGNHWAELLKNHPEYADRCPWQKLDGEDWSDLLLCRPQFADRCPWDKLGGGDWGSLLYEQPQFADHCSWDKLSGYDWSILLRGQPQFADKCPWDKLIGDNWTTLLCRQPRFADRCPWDKLSNEDWIILLLWQPQFADRFPWDKLNANEWARFLWKRPQFADKCPWDKLSGDDWAILLYGQPQFAARCPWDQLDGHNWASLLGHQPKYAINCAWDKLNGEDWMNLLTSRSMFASQCQWDRLDGNDWGKLLRRRPQFADKCPWDKLNGDDWHDLLIWQPQFEDRCLWDKLDGFDWAVLLVNRPQFAEKCPWDKLSGRNWALLLEVQPQFADKCPWDKLDGENWADLLIKQPQFADKCPWDKLDWENWVCLLQNQPQFADKCPWDKLSGSNWALLLEVQPQFADKCPWDKLGDEDWANLLRTQPQFAKKKT